MRYTGCKSNEDDGGNKRRKHDQVLLWRSLPWLLTCGRGETNRARSLQTRSSSEYLETTCKPNKIAENCDNIDSADRVESAENANLVGRDAWMSLKAAMQQPLFIHSIVHASVAEVQLILHTPWKCSWVHVDCVTWQWGYARPHWFLSVVDEVKSLCICGLWGVVGAWKFVSPSCPLPDNFKSQRLDPRLFQLGGGGGKHAATSVQDRLKSSWISFWRGLKS
jgi:hypothetical protein